MATIAMVTVVLLLMGGSFVVLAIVFQWIVGLVKLGRHVEVPSAHGNGDQPGDLEAQTPDPKPQNPNHA
ncbi:hypothetical protein AMTR_s00105p00141240 [Amborella trichopoda]|uniref:Uncharacterized protein n=1 Tax=Amborella trichopoda TaxID=13333 RepID=W1NXT2_AMBTC|nr:hypothetical protein AMTR_s00105p00141240 [Amborella trichopoda]